MAFTYVSRIAMVAAPPAIGLIIFTLVPLSGPARAGDGPAAAAAPPPPEAALAVKAAAGVAAALADDSVIAPAATSAAASLFHDTALDDALAGRRSADLELRLILGKAGERQRALVSTLTAATAKRDHTARAIALAELQSFMATTRKQVNRPDGKKKFLRLPCKGPPAFFLNYSMGITTCSHILKSLNPL